MKPNTGARRWLLGVALLATVVAAIYAPPGEDTVQAVAGAGAPLPRNASTVERAREQAAPSDAAAELEFVPKKRVGLHDEPGDLFRVDRPPPAATAASRSAPAPKPVALPFPYVYMGKMVENDELTVFLTRQNKPYVVHAGDMLDGQYRVESIRPPLIEFTYIPLGQKQLLNMGAMK